MKEEKKISAEFTSVHGEVDAKNRRKEKNAPGWTAGQKVFVDGILMKLGYFVLKRVSVDGKCKKEEKIYLVLAICDIILAFNS